MEIESHHSSAEQAAEVRLIPRTEVKRLTSLSSTTIWRLMRQQKFPAPVELSPGRVAWRESEIRRWIADRCAPGNKGGRAA